MNHSANHIQGREDSRWPHVCYPTSVGYTERQSYFYHVCFFPGIALCFCSVAKTWSHVGGVDSDHVLDLQNATRKNLICEEEKQKNPTCLSALWLVMWISFRDLWMVLNINSQCQMHLTQMRCIQFNPLTFYVFCKSVDSVFRCVQFAWYWIFSVLKLVQSLQVPPWEKVLESYRTDPRIPL